MDGATVAYKVNELAHDPRVSFDPAISKAYVTYAHRIAARGLVAGVGYHWRALDTLPEVIGAIATVLVALALLAVGGATAVMVCA